MSEFESLLFLSKEVFVYQIPPRQANAGYRATEWDVDNPIFKARLRVLLAGEEKCVVRLEDKGTGELFAACPVDPKGLAVEQGAGLESDEATGSKMYIGIGFLDRSEAFDFNVALEDFRRSLVPAETGGSGNASGATALAAEPKLDFSLKPDQKITVKMAGFKKKPAASGQTPASSVVGQPILHSAATAAGGWPSIDNPLLCLLRRLAA
ncbi:adaptin ear-binding coat-associated protein 1 NECAP-1 [Linderina pennispora]|uniref:Adaptin ear-binding coat-associated protein 1 NECAP-1 n=1 Tax=Linderina pennispora TaxID=61395 RepID=A0A1Y1VWG3_9FUNG|nr:adaptin ear-binding coat-associated protein 1 NECAP-1 [Linderina pennispora]ORX65637.1 adaptin ear-binding coat-associated protein 1 NECAP-1 [Linderina pennispora]